MNLTNQNNHFSISKKLNFEELSLFQKLLEYREMKSLEIIDFQPGNLDENLLKILQKYTNIKTLSFSDSLNFTEGFILISDIILNNPIEDLKLNFERSGQTKIILKALQETKHLKNITISHRIESKDFIFFQKMINGNSNLKSVKFNDNYDKQRVQNDISEFINGINDNYTIEKIEIEQMSFVIKDFTFLEKFKSLKTLDLSFNSHYMNEKSDKVFDFSISSLKELNIKSKMENQHLMLLLFKGLKQSKLEKLNFLCSPVFKGDISTYSWLDHFKDFLKSSKSLLDLTIHFVFINAEFEIILQSIQENNSLQSLHLSGNINFQERSFGKLLASKKNLQDLCINNRTFLIQDFMSEFQFNNTLYSLDISTFSKFSIKTEEYYSNFISNNSNIKKLSLRNVNLESKDQFQILCNEIINKSKVEVLELPSLSLEIILKLIQSLSCLKTLIISVVSIQRRFFKDFLHFLIENDTIESVIFCSLVENDMEEKEILEMIQEHLIYNYSLITFDMGKFKSKFTERNLKFIKNHLKIHHLKKDLFFNFE